MKNSGRYSFVILILVLILLIPLFYYSDRIKIYLADPSRFFKAALSATGLANFGINFILINMGIFLSAALVELISLGWEKSAINRLIFKRDRSSAGDLWCWILSVFSIYDFFVIVFSLGLFYVISSIIVKAGGFNMLEFIPFTWLKLILVFALVDLKHYLWHRFMHTRPFWELHKYHHSATEFNLITTARGHFLEKGILVVFDSILFSLIGAPPSYFILFLIVQEFYDQLLHSNINSSFGWFGKYIFISPQAHRLHHSDEQKHYDKNYGNMLIFWDKLFGTYMSTQDKITIGVKDSPYNVKGFWWDMKEGSRSFGAASLDSFKNRISLKK